MDLSALVKVKKQPGEDAEAEETRQSWDHLLPSKQEDLQMSRQEKAERRKQRQENLKRQMQIARDNVVRREKHDKKTAKARQKAKITRDISWGSKLLHLC